MTDVLLLNPPFADPDAPNISIPALAAYLKSQGIRTQARDLNREFFRRFLTPSRVLAGSRYAEKRLIELNGRARLNGLDMLEYARLAELLDAAGRCSSRFDLLRTGLADFDDLQQAESWIKRLFVRIASTPHFPEGITLTPSLDYWTPFKTFSSNDILKAAESRTMFSGILEEVLGEVLGGTIPRVIGISAVFSTQLMPAFYCAKIVKRLASDAHVTVGGPAAFIFMRELQERGIFDLVDSLVMDDGEIPLHRLLEEVKSGRPDFSRVPGLKYVCDGRIRTNPSAPPPDLESLPAPDYTVFQLDGYLAKRETMRVPFRLSRGCYWRRCSFCRTALPFVQCYQQPDVGHIYGQLKQVIQETGTRKFIFSDESCRPDVLERLCGLMLEDGVSIDWIAHTRVSTDLTRERCELYRRAGCTMLSLGVESLHDRILNLMRKGITLELIGRVTRQIGGVIPIRFYMIVGFPSETEEEALAGYERARRYLQERLIVGIIYSPFTLLYGSDIWKNWKRYGIGSIHYPEGSDLLPETRDFECSGMSREKASELYSRFMPMMSPVAATNLRDVVIGGQRVRLNFDLESMRSVVETQCLRKIYSSSGDLLEAVDNTAGIRAVRRP